jgi:hypothetical protein
MQIESVFAHDPPEGIEARMIARLTPKIKPGKFRIKMYLGIF